MEQINANKTKIKVLTIVNRFNIGGITYNITFLNKYLGPSFETKLIGGPHEENEGDSLYILNEYDVSATIVQEMKRKPSLLGDFKAFIQIRKIIKEFKPDIVHTHASKAGFIGRIAAITCRTKIIVHTFHGHVFHSYFGNFKTFIIKIIEKVLAKFSHGIIAVSELQKNELGEIYKICGVNKIKVIPYGFDLKKFNSNAIIHRNSTRERYQISDHEIAIAIIGRLTEIKNHDFFLKVIDKVKEQTSKSIRVFIVGDGDLRSKIELKVKELNEKYSSFITMTSWIKEIDTFIPAMDIICLTSDNEGAPISLIEAQASNVSVISTNVGGVKDVLLNENTGFIVEKDDLKDYSEKLLLLVENDEIRKKMSQNGWTFVEDKFHYTRLVSEMESFYYELLRKNK